MEDPDDFPLRALPEIEMAIYSIQVGNLRVWTAEAKDELSLWNETEPGFDLNEGETDATAFDNVFLPNFQYKPKVTMQRGKWYRFRMLMASELHMPLPWLLSM